MAKDFNKNSPHVPASISTAIYRTTKPSFEFYSIFSEEEVLRIIHSLELKREIPLKYSYKGKGAKIWNDFYLKYIIMILKKNYFKFFLNQIIFYQINIL